MSRLLNSQTHAWLKVFAVSARHLSFTRAAEELHVTTGAVSQQIKQLEDRLGFKLFRRLPRRLALTEEGRRLATVVDDAYQAVGLEVKRLRSGVMSGIIRLRSVPSFLNKWLMPRLPRLQARFPDIELHVTAEDSSTSLREGDFDLALDLNDGQTPGLAITPLIEETIFPVCSPSLLRGRPPLRRPEDLAWYPLLHDVTAWRGSRDYGEWEHYLEAIEAPSVNVHRGYTFNRNHLTMEAAIAGMGVAIARQTLITNELETGALIAPLERRVATGMHYGIVYAAGALDDRRVRAVHDWLVEEARRPQPIR
ncbi:LysR substrate-binding domain-containing protein [Halomonas elongata]|uniref:LysR family transcription regulator n=1 Tax=Halomonas elongata (strain ATCC 33173 / DSM 2581 / NBRC 15536 / NCIMB 2198 / 1H9) TaxID=768066 RepID=E1V6X4_HALED|nr:LysR substrate-binding domain-containing protein [Halomonas elongata]MBW5799561.1 LysR family transcriptional regulator [Halomonas elongata]MDL4861609.1 LysR substrate-binding domain-containing protein [Halomonas elongata]WBF17104.1 LysR substrate-binding domain-containing protein [Halomonas elongata]WPU45938.1 LysR substrate-binding domain-containing protein [Halomonas elongata DSM 2581]WVI70758.1 LysR substrate-binding domain-containing protein [Halomonas elongata]